MKASKLRALWIIIASSFYVAYICFSSIIMYYLGKNTRQWVDGRMEWWSTRILNLVKAKVTVFHAKRFKSRKDQATIVMCNHSSLYDIPVTLYAFPHSTIRMLAKKELSKIPCMGQGMRAAEFPFVDRKNRSQAIQDLLAVRKLLESGVIMWIAPEGSRTPSGKLGPFKKGGFITAIETQARIIPIGIRNANAILPARTLQFNLHQQVEVHVGEPIDASEYTLDKKEVLMERVHQAMEKLVGE